MHRFKQKVRNRLQAIPIFVYFYCECFAFEFHDHLYYN